MTIIFWIQTLDRTLIATVKQFYKQQVYDYLCNDTDISVELQAMEKEIKNITDIDNPDLVTSLTPSPPPPVAEPSSVPASMSAIALWQCFSVKDAVDFLSGWDRLTTAVIHYAWWLLKAAIV